MQKFFLLIIVIVFVPSCKKDTTFDSPRIKKLTHGIYWALFSYDCEGRCTQLVAQSGYTNSFTYSAGQVVSEVPSGKTIYYLDSRGYAMSDNRGYTYTIDVDGHMTSVISSFDTTNFTWANGNIVSVSGRIQPGVYTYTYTYLNEENTIGSNNEGRLFRGKDSKNLIDTYSYAAYGDTTWHKFFYEYDIDGKVAVQTDSIIGSGTDITSYTYY
jgi:hypothetical protein